MKCPVCNGKGKQVLDFELGKFNVIIKCLFCYGKKELDWIEVIFGVDFGSLIKEKQLRNKYEVSEL